MYMAPALETQTKQESGREFDCRLSEVFEELCQKQGIAEQDRAALIALAIKEYHNSTEHEP